MAGATKDQNPQQYQPDQKEKPDSRWVFAGQIAGIVAICVGIALRIDPETALIVAGAFLLTGPMITEVDK